MKMILKIVFQAESVKDQNKSVQGGGRALARGGWEKGVWVRVGVGGSYPGIL